MSCRRNFPLRAFRAFQTSRVHCHPVYLQVQKRLLQPAQLPFVREYTAAAEDISQHVASESQLPDSSEASQEPNDTSPKTKENAQPEKDKEREIIDLKDKYLRSVADFRNLQDRTAREVAAARDFAISRFAGDLVDSVDNLDRALATVPEARLKPNSKTRDKAGNDPIREADQDLMNLYGGLKMTEKVLMQTLAKHGLERFDPAERGAKFDPKLHEASFMAPIEGKEDGTVFSTMQKGFSLNGRVIRAAKVGVVKN